MIDSIHIRLDNYYINLQQREKLFSITNIHTQKENVKGCSFFGKYKNFNVAFNPNNVAINGSLPKFVLGHNIHAISVAETKSALYQLQQETGLSLLKGELQRVDLAECFFLNTDNLAYHFHSLLPTPEYERIPAPKLVHGVRYTQADNLVLAFYNKTLETIKTPEVRLSDNQQVMRIEMRIMKNVRRTVMNRSSQFGVLYLLSPSFHRRLARFWLNHFNNIIKQRIIYKYGDMQGLKDFNEFLLACQINSMGLEACYSALDIIAGQNNWDTRTRTGVKKKMLEYSKSTIATVPNRYIKELEDQVQSSYIYQLANNAL